MSENTLKIPAKTEEKDTPKTPESPANTGFVDSDNGGIEDFRKVLNIPVEKPEQKPDENTFEKEDPFGDTLGDMGEDFEDMFDPEGEGMDALFEDSDALAEMCVELLDLGMNYASQAISMDWGQDEKYSIPEHRKRKLRKPLAKLLEKRAPKVSPELAFLVFALAIYSPQLIKAYGVRREKLNSRKSNEAKPMAIPPNPTIGGVTKDEADEYDAFIREMRSKSKELNIQPPKTNEPEPQPKRKAGRPKGSKDTKPRKPRTTSTTSKPTATTRKKTTGTKAS